MSIAGAAAAVIASSSGPALAQGSWQCSAPGLVTGTYSGGASAYIHLAGFSTGGSYSVARRGSVASGVTANGTRFACRLAGAAPAAAGGQVECFTRTAHPVCRAAFRSFPPGSLPRGQGAEGSASVGGRSVRYSCNGGIPRVCRV